MSRLTRASLGAARAAPPSAAPVATLLALLLAAAALLAGCGRAGRPVAEAPLAVRIAALRSQTAGRGDLWPGFAPDAVPLLVFAEGATWLFGHPDPPAGFVPVPAREAGGITGAARFPGRHPAAEETGVAELGAAPTVVIVAPPPRSAGGADAEEVAGAPDPAALATLALGLSFEVHGAATGWRVDPTGFLTPLDLQAEPLALRRLETEALRRALAAPEAAEAGAWARAAMDLRARRHRLLAPALVSTERSLELVEGTAERTARLGAATLRRKARVAHPPPPWAGLLPPGGFPAGAVRERSRAAGAAIALLLDRLEPEWPALVPGTLPDRLLARAGEGRADAPARLAEDTVARERARAGDDVEARRRELRARYEAAIGRPGWRVVVEAQPGLPLQVVAPDPDLLVAIDSTTVLHEGGLRLSNERAEIVVDREAVTTLVPGSSPPTAVAAVFVAGVEDEPEVTRGRPGDVTVTAAGFRGAFTGAHVEKEGMNLHVVVPARPAGR